MEQKRPRGRPKGAQIEDGWLLDMVADLMHNEPGLKKTPAIARVVAENFLDQDHQHAKVQRRLLRKWNQDGDERLAAVPERRAEAERLAAERKRQTKAAIKNSIKRMGEIGDALAGFVPFLVALQRAAKPFVALAVSMGSIRPSWPEAAKSDKS